MATLYILMRNLDFIKRTFKNHFYDIYERFEDERELSYPEYDEDGVFPHFFFKENAIVQENWTDEIIEIRFNKEIINSHIIDNSEWDIEFLENYIKEIANHEYGHTMTLRSIFCLYPKDTRHILMEKNIKNITKEDLTRCYVESKCYPLEFFELKNINLQIFEQIFLDFWANMMVRDKIDDNPPEQILNERLNGFYGITPKVINRNTFLKLLLFTQLFFIHERWHILEEIMRKSELDKLLWLYMSINVFYNKIIKFNSDFDTMEEDLVELASILETLNFSEIISKNKITNQDNVKLRTFINRLREKEARK